MVDRPIYLDAAATTAVDPRVADILVHYLTDEYGNAGSRTHEYGSRAHRAVDTAREQAAAVVRADPSDVVFTSGATEANNLALLGLAEWGRASGRTHLLTTRIEHKAVLEPLEALAKRGFDVEFVEPTAGGWVEPAAVVERLRGDTLAISVMHVNNETGIRQPVERIAEDLGDHPAYFHVDAAQGFARDLDALRHPRIDLVSVSGHKLHAPMGVGALIHRRRGHERPPLAPLLYGGGQERGLRPGTISVPLIAAFGLAAELAVSEVEDRAAACRSFRSRLLEALDPLQPAIHGDQDRAVDHIVNLSFCGLDSEAVVLLLKDLVAISNGSACTSEHIEPSHVLLAMGLPSDQIAGALRWSWSHDTPEPDWQRVRDRLIQLR